MRSVGNSAYDPKIADLGFIFSQSGTTHSAQGMFHA
jgi:hypothetical protein